MHSPSLPSSEELQVFQRIAENPVLGPQGNTWEAHAVFNPAAWTDGSQIYLLYRAEGSCDFPGRLFTSRIGLATSHDGITFVREPKPVLEPTESYEIPGGCEDPRITRIGDVFYMTYTAYDGTTARIAMAVSHDLHSWEKQGLLFPERVWTKSAVIVPKQIDGRYWMYFGDTHLWAAHSTDLTRWTVVEEPVLSPRPGHFDSQLVEPGPVPILTTQGIQLIYNSADHELRYAVGQCLFAANDPCRLLHRIATPLLEPSLPEERLGQVPNVVFATGHVQFHDKWLLYYGMGDTHTGLAVWQSI